MAPGTRIISDPHPRNRKLALVIIIAEAMAAVLRAAVEIISKGAEVQAQCFGMVIEMELPEQVP